MARAHVIKKVKLEDGKWYRIGATRRARGSELPHPVETLRVLETRWEVRYRDGGRGSRLRGHGTFTSKRAAEERAKVLELELSRHETPGRARTLRMTTMRDAMIDYRDHRRSDLDAKTVRTIDQAINRLGDLATVPLADLVWQDFDRWMAGNATTLARSTRLLYMRWYRLGLRQADVQPNPAGDERINRGVANKPTIGAPTFEQACRVEHSLLNRRGRRTPSEYHPVFRFLHASGARELEAIGVLCEHVDGANGRIFIATTKKNTSGRRWIPITSELAPLIEGLDPLARDPKEPLLVLRGRDGSPRPLTENGIYKAFWRASHAARLPSILGPHDLRHRHLSRLIAAGIPLPEVQRIAGHSNLSSIERRYAHALPGEPREPLRVLRRDVRRFFDDGRAEGGLEFD